jgi:hypothetical protein
MQTLIDPPARTSRSTPDAACVFELDGGYVFLDPAGAGPGTELLSLDRSHWRSDYVTLVVDAGPEALERGVLSHADTARAFDRVLICDGGDRRNAEAAAALERAVRRWGRVECRRIADPCRALRHCIDAMLSGDVVIYRCANQRCALEFLEEHGATPIDGVPGGRRNTRAGAVAHASGAEPAAPPN